MSESLVEVTFALDDTSLDEYEQQEFAKKLLKQLREQGDAESLDCKVDKNSCKRSLECNSLAIWV